MDKHNFDVAIVGAGTAGTAAAIKLRQNNLKVCLMDVRDFSKRRIGESLPGAALRLLNSLGISGLDELMDDESFQACMGNISSWGSEHWQYSDAMRNPEGGGWHILRNEFDLSLLKKAQTMGAVFLPTKLGKIESLKTGHRLFIKSPLTGQAEQIKAHWLIDATGRSRSLAKHFGVKQLQSHSQFAAIAWIKTPESDQDQQTKIKTVPNGWWYTALLPDRTRVIVFHGLPKDIAFKVKNPNQFFLSFNAAQLIPYETDTDLLLEKIIARDASASRLEQPIGKNWLSIGDACLAFDPISSQGMFFAMYSGIIGAETIKNAMEQNGHGQNQYSEKIKKVYRHNQSQRQYFYQMENRFLNKPYWQQYHSSLPTTA
ncbi:NAD(P)/FAD-dependent oxidoreductase [Echinicola salinicaeni]|uniref:NAD(P)/FAD-dependent oxidoreductase n=1 Tax=Echinicola salinicaeni TaxID=2762757 RepID=UPI00164649E3|nr:tryptophan 7-halogenase [Echinicola salinicaeni]